MWKASGAADVIELRLDYIRDFDLKKLLSSKKRPVIVTCRPKRQGGLYDGPEEKRLAVLQDAMRAGADYVDVEYDCIDRLQKTGDCKLIVSYHNFDGAPDDLSDIYWRMSSSFADIVKVAVQVTDVLDNAVLFDILMHAAKPTIALGMSEGGVPSRVLAPKFGGFLTYASLAEGKESAPGQVTAQELIDFYKFRRINADTKIYGVVGKPVYHSVSPYLFNSLFAETGHKGVYLFFEVEDVGRFVSVMRRYDIGGFSVTIPHKEKALDAVDEVAGAARDIGALNTIAKKDDTLYGFNTDMEAAVCAIEDGLGGKLSGKRVLLLGAGGAARAVCYGLKRAGARLTILNRTVSRGRQLAERAGCAWGPLERAGEVDYDILVNCTSTGMSPKTDESPVPAEFLREGTLVFDAVYTPVETRLLREARAAGAKTVSGLEMFIRQAALQFEIWTAAAGGHHLQNGYQPQKRQADVACKSAPVEIIRKILEDRR